jgi:small subunit ribosomal protein S35
VRQGWVPLNKKAMPSKFANAELMKIPNFLHLTPPVISKQCEVLKKFCTPWPKGLESEEVQEKHFPIQFISSDYIHALPTIKNPLSRIVTIKIKLEKLKLDKHARDKFIRLVAERYDPETDELTIVTDRCPLKKQNYDYGMYLLTALYHESNIFEDWESSKSEADMEYYDWNRNKSKETSTEVLNWRSTSAEKIEPPQEYAKSVEALMNEGENEYNLNKYKEQVLKMLGIAST